MNMMLSEIADSMQGILTGEDVAITSVSIDTKTLTPGQLYVAIKGRNFDGNDFVAEAEQAGAIAAIVRKGIKPSVSHISCLLYTSPSPRDRTRSRMPSSA